jgi:hypothetical protein
MVPQPAIPAWLQTPNIERANIPPATISDPPIMDSIEDDPIPLDFETLSILLYLMLLGDLPAYRQEVCTAIHCKRTE